MTTRSREYDRLTSAGRGSARRFPKPIIARIRGFCLGGGLAIAMQADIRIAAEDSEFGIPAARLGIAYGFDSGAPARLAGRARPCADAALHRRAHRRARRQSASGWSTAWCRTRTCPTTVARPRAHHRRQRAAFGARHRSAWSARCCATRPSATSTPWRRRSPACFDSRITGRAARAFMEKRPPRFVGR